MDDNDELSAPDKAVFQSLQVDRPPSPGLEQRVLDELATRGLVRPPARPAPWWRGRRLAVAACWLALVGAAFVAGRGTDADRGLLLRQPAEPTFALLIYEAPETWLLPDTQQGYDETSRWISEMRADGVYQGGARLQDSAALVALDGTRVVPASGIPADATRVLSGFLLISADDRDDAQRIAATSPLLRYGMSIEIREILPD